MNQYTKNHTKKAGVHHGNTRQTSSRLNINCMSILSGFLTS